MTWETKLIATYLLICDQMPYLSKYTIRQSNNYLPDFTDEEVMTIYCFCTMDTIQMTTKKAMYTYADRHLRSWFPKLPRYEAFVQRCNALNNAFERLAGLLIANICEQKPEYYHPVREFIVDSLPIMLAQRHYSKTAKVATEIANNGWCATKKVSYHGFKLHAASLMAPTKHLPTPCVMVLTPASVHDNRAFKEDIAPNCPFAIAYADSAYHDESAAPQLWEDYRLKVEPIQKRVKGQNNLFFDQILKNSAISHIRQPIEGFFNWLIEHTNIQNASKCRSAKGVLLHVFGKIAAAAAAILILNS